jgi:hypothetical protein
MRIHETFFIGGEQVRPAGTGVLEVRSPATEELIGRAPEGSPADIDRAVAAAREAFDEGPWPRLSPAERADALARLNEQLMLRQEEHGPGDHRRGRLADHLLAHRAGPRAEHGAQLLRGPPPHLRPSTSCATAPSPRCGCCASRWAWSRRSSPGTCRSSWPCSSSPRRSRRAAPWCSSPRRRHRSSPTCSPRPSRPPSFQGRRQHRHRGARGGRAPRPSPRRGQGELHRQHRGRQAHRRPLRRAAPPGDAGAGREIRGHLPRRLRASPSASPS